MGPDSTEKSKRRELFNPENIKIQPFKLEFVDSEEEDHTAAMKEIRKDFAGFTSKIMNVTISDNMYPASGTTMRVWMNWALI